MTTDRLFIFLYTDEDVTNRLAPLLREQGYEALSSAEAGNDGLTDAEQLAFAAGRGWVILTYNVGISPTLPASGALRAASMRES